MYYAWGGELILGDFDGDRRADFAASTDDHSCSLRIAYNEGGGRLEAARAYPVSARGWRDYWATYLLPKDLDRDGDADLSVACASDDAPIDQILIFDNRGDGTFREGSSIKLRRKDPELWEIFIRQLVAEDFDGDGWVDLAACGYRDAWSGAAISWNRGDGTFGEELDMVVLDLFPRFSFETQDMGAADLDGDGDLDIATLNGERRVVIAWNTAPRVFGEQSEIDLRALLGQKLHPFLYTELGFGDFDRDGDTDIALLYWHDDPDPTVPGLALGLLKNQGARNFTFEKVARIDGWRWPERGLGHPANAMAEGDIDGDGSLDLILHSFAGPYARDGSIWTILKNDGRGNFSRETQRLMNTGSVLRLLDLDRDGDLDLAATAREMEEVVVLLNEASGSVRGTFRRGDLEGAATGDRVGNAIRLLYYLFFYAPPILWEKAADVDDDGRLLITDAIYLLRYEIFGGDPPPEPFWSCGLDPTPDALEECLSEHWFCR